MFFPLDGSVPPYSCPCVAASVFGANVRCNEESTRRSGDDVSKDERVGRCRSLAASAAQDGVCEDFGAQSSVLSSASRECVCGAAAPCVVGVPQIRQGRSGFTCSTWGRLRCV